MRYRVLIIWPFLVVALYIVGCLAIGVGPARRPFMRAEIEFVKALALIGCWAAAFRFGRKDYLRWAWFLSGLCYLLLLARDAIFIPGFLGQGRGIDYMEGGVILLANISSVVGTAILARAWTVAGLEPPGTRVGRGAIIAIAILISFTIAGPAVYVDFRDFIRGAPVSLVGFASDLGDIVSFCLIAPVLLTALALRGGSLVWPWGLMTASMLGWLCYDGATLVGNTILHGDAVTVRTVADVFRSLACLFALSAGLAQRMAMGSKTEATASAPSVAR
jgi:hypothetical protein